MVRVIIINCEYLQTQKIDSSCHNHVLYNVNSVHIKQVLHLLLPQ